MLPTISGVGAALACCLVAFHLRLMRRCSSKSEGLSTMGAFWEGKATCADLGCVQRTLHF